MLIVGSGCCVFSWATAWVWGLEPGWCPPGLRQGLAQEHLDLGVDAAQVVGGPAGQRIVQGGVDAQQQLLTLRAHEE